MTLDEAIMHAEEVASRKFDDRVHCIKCAEEHRQLAEWLKDYRRLKEQTRWIPVKFRPLTEEEQKEYPDYCYMADCPMPDEGEEILVTTTHGTVEKDEAEFDDGFYLDSGYDWQTDIVAWMPLPEPHKAESD